MANLVLLTADTAHAAATNTKSALEGAGHTVTLHVDSDYAALSHTSYDGIVTVRTSSSISDVIANKVWEFVDASKPAVIGMLVTSLSGTGIRTVADYMGLIGTAEISASNTEDSQVITDNSHFITSVFPLAEVTVNTSLNYMAALDEGASYVGVSLATGDTNSSLVGQKSLIAIETGTQNLAATKTTNARIVIWGGLYAGQSDYTADGKTLLGRIADWALGAGAALLSGTITEAGANVARTVRAYRRDTGVLLAETVSGGMPYRDEILADNPVAYWRLGEASGTTAADESANNLDGSYYFVPLGAPGLLTGDSDTAVEMTSGAYVDMPDNAALNITQNLSVEAWIKFSNSQANRAIVAKWGADQAYLLYIDHTDSNKIHFSVRIGDTSNSIISPNTYNDDAPHHVVGVYDYDNSQLKLYIDGAEVTSAAVSGLIDNPANNPVRIGNYNTQGSNGFVGIIDEVATYNVALTPARIQAHYDAGVAALAAGQYQFTDLSGYTGEVYVIILDDDGSHNDLIYDRLAVS